MNAALELAIDMVIRFVLRPEIERRYGGSVPGKVLAAASTRIRALIAEGKASDFTTAKTLTLFALSEAVKELDKERIQ